MTRQLPLDQWLQKFPSVELTADSRQVTSGSIFFALPGVSSDGHQFLNDVCQKNPLAVVVEDAGKVPSSFKGEIYATNNTKAALIEAAVWRYNSPSTQLKIYGVTGTNGKTTVTHLIEYLSQNQNLLCGVMGTIDHHVGSTIWESQLTTPDVVTLQKRLHEMRNLGAGAVAMEVSSHALEQQRVSGVEFDVALFTNLTRDHLDYHGTMDNYFAAKKRLFTEILKNSSKTDLRAVINIDDPWGAKIQVPNITVFYGRAPKATVRLLHTELSYKGGDFKLDVGGTTLELHTPQVGEFNIYNAVAALTAVVPQIAINEFQTASQHLSQFAGVRGRLERVVAQPFSVFVDYAHTDDALKSVLVTLQAVRASAKTKSRIITVFGCGGDRDKGKRPMMMQAALQGSDLIVATSDNPRSEDPMAIIQDMLVAVAPADKHRVHVQPDRRAAIQWALNEAHLGDVVLIAGKGHEMTQQIGDVKYPFSDQDVVLTSLKKS